MTGLRTITLSDWRIGEGDADAEELTTAALKAPWQLTIEETGSLYLKATAPDGTQREILIEIDRGNLVVRVYRDPEISDEPAVSLYVGDDVVRATDGHASNSRIVAFHKNGLVTEEKGVIPPALLQGNLKRAS